MNRNKLTSNVEPLFLSFGCCLSHLGTSLTFVVIGMDSNHGPQEFANYFALLILVGGMVAPQRQPLVSKNKIGFCFAQLRTITLIPVLDMVEDAYRRFFVRPYYSFFPSGASDFDLRTQAFKMPLMT